MDLLEKINRSFGTWYEGLFGGTDDVRPKDILRKILSAMEDHRKEGFDNRVYVPNQYILEIDVNDEEEKEYLLSFLDRDELEAAIRRYCQQNHYHIRGSLDFTVRESDPGDRAAGERRFDKVRVRCRYNTKVTAPEAVVADVRPAPVEERTVASAWIQAESVEETGTVPAIATATLVVYAPNRPPFRFPIRGASITIGRSTRGNDLVIDSDGQISKQHARIELEPDRRFTLYDMNSTNGTRVNGRRIGNRALNDGDEILLGETRLTFQQSGEQRPAAEQACADRSRAVAPTPDSLAPGHLAGAFGGAASPPSPRIGGEGEGRGGDGHPARLVLIDRGQDVDDYLLASETLLGRGVTNDVVLPDRSIATRHARIVRDGAGYAVESLAEAAVVTVNGERVHAEAVPIGPGDRIGLGDLEFRFDG
jgi:pSer/pThr/pTyr-binding forkhead associated (FHA) protein